MLGNWELEVDRLFVALRGSRGAEDVSESVIVLVALERIDLIRVRRHWHRDRPWTGPCLRIVERCRPVDSIRRHARLVGYLDVSDPGVVRNVNRRGD